MAFWSALLTACHQQPANCQEHAHTALRVNLPACTLVAALTCSVLLLISPNLSAQGKLWLEDHAASSDQGQDPAEQDNGWLEQAESREDGGPDEEGNEQLSWSVAGDSAAERHDAGDSGQAAAVPSKQRKRSRARSTTETGENNAEPALDAVEQPVKRKRGRPRKHPPSPA